MTELTFEQRGFYDNCKLSSSALYISIAPFEYTCCIGDCPKDRRSWHWTVESDLRKHFPPTVSGNSPSREEAVVDGARALVKLLRERSDDFAQRDLRILESFLSGDK